MVGYGHAFAEHMSVTHYPPTIDDIAQAIKIASSLDEGAYAHLSKQAKLRADKCFSYLAFSSQFAELMEALNAISHD